VDRGRRKATPAPGVGKKGTNRFGGVRLEKGPEKQLRKSSKGNEGNKKKKKGTKNDGDNKKGQGWRTWTKIKG